jgi:hypothetical protein
MHALGAKALAEPGELDLGALVEPDHARTQRLAVLVEKTKGLALIGDAEAGNARRVDLGGQLPERPWLDLAADAGFLDEFAAGEG